MHADAVPRFRPLWLCALLASACTASSFTHALAKESAAMTSHPRVAPLQPDELSARMLKLIGSIHGAADLSPENIERQTGLTVDIRSHDRSDYGLIGQVQDRGDYSLSAVSYRPGQAATRLDLRLSPRAGAGCALEFGALRDALLAAGFAADGPQQPAGLDDPGYRTTEPWSYVRDEVEVELYPADDRAAGQGHPTCLNKISIHVDA